MKTIIDFLPNLKRKGAHEYAGPCPFCGGKNRFIVWTNNDKGGRCFCRRCNFKGDRIEILRKQGFSFHDAQIYLEMEGHSSYLYEPKHRELAKLALANRAYTPTPSIDHVKWSNRAKEFVEWSISHKEPDILKPWESVLTKKHIRMETALKHQIGWNPQDYRDSPCKWGFSENESMYIPKGLVIPNYVDSQIVGVNIRVANPDFDKKYHKLKGSRSAPMYLGTCGKPLIIVESELDAYLIFQEESHRVNAVALGGVNCNFSDEAAAKIGTAPKILVATDVDDTTTDELGAGQNAWFKLRKRFPTAVYFPPARGKDPSDMVDLGGSISTWVDFALDTLDSGDTLKLPDDLQISFTHFKEMILEHPTLVPCPITVPKWYWSYRKDCGDCKGHIQCLKDVDFKL